MSPLATPQPGNRVSCLCLRCVRACVTRREISVVSRHVFVPAAAAPAASPSPAAASFQNGSVFVRVF